MSQLFGFVWTNVTINNNDIDKIYDEKYSQSHVKIRYTDNDPNKTKIIRSKLCLVNNYLN